MELTMIGGIAKDIHTRPLQLDVVSLSSLSSNEQTFQVLQKI